MHKGNRTTMEFIFIGFSNVPELQYFLFTSFLCIYCISLAAHTFLIVLYNLSINLHTPMYFFLANFSFLEKCYITTITPNMLKNLLSNHKAITFYGCAVQMYCFVLLVSTECYLLAAMAYDRYNAICHPLLYNVIMSKNACVKLIVSSWIIGLMVAIIQTALTFSLPYCGPNNIYLFYCDIPPVLALACSETQFNEIVTFILVLILHVAFLLTIVSYARIIWTIIKHHSSARIKKAFSTSTSHLIVVTIFYGSGSVMYLRSKLNYGTDMDKFLSLMYTVFVPLLNPFIYSLRNNDVKYAVRKMVRNMK